MKYFLTLSLLFLLAVAGCTGDSMITSDDPADVAGKHAGPKMVPMEQYGTFTAHLPSGTIDCGYDQVFFRRFDALVDFSHLGATTGVMNSHECWVNLPEGTLGVRGDVAFAAANGDELYGDWTVVITRDPKGGAVSTFVFDPPVQFTGGTGRLDGVSGSGSGEGMFNTATYVGAYWIAGEMSSVGSMK